MAKNSLYDFSTTAADNTDIGNIGVQGTNDVRNFDNAFREFMAQVAAFIFDNGGTLTAGGSANALTVTTNAAIATLATGQMVVLKAASSNTGAATLNVNALGARDIKKYLQSGEADIAANDIRAGGLYALTYDAAADGAVGAWILANPSMQNLATTASPSFDDLALAGEITVGGGAVAGSVTSPTVSFGSSTGFYRTASTIAATYNGSLIASILATGLSVSGDLTLTGSIDGPSNFTIGNGSGEEIVFEDSTGRLLLRTAGSTRLLIDSTGSSFAPDMSFGGSVTVGNGVVAGSGASPTLSFGSSTGFYRVSNAIRATYSGSAIMDILSTGIAVTGSLTLSGNIDGPNNFTVGNGSGEEIAFEETTGRVIIRTLGTTSLRVDSDGTLVSSPTYNSTTAVAANMYVATNGLFQRSTSARKYKTDIEPLTDDYIAKALLLDGITYRSLIETDNAERVHIGIVADDAHEKGLRELVSYGESGDVEGFQYERLTAVLLEIVKRQQATILDLGNRLDIVEGSLSQ